MHGQVGAEGVLNGGHGGRGVHGGQQGAQAQGEGVRGSGHQVGGQDRRAPAVVPLRPMEIDE